METTSNDCSRISNISCKQSSPSIVTMHNKTRRSWFAISAAAVLVQLSALAFASEAPIGFGASTTGGEGGRICEVTSLADAGNNTLRACLNDGGPVQISFGVSGTIETTKYLYLTDNVTIDGSNADITISGEDGFACFGNSNIIIRHLKVTDVGSGMRFREKCTNVWIDHVYITRALDEGIAIDQGSTNVTISHSHIENTDKAILIGSNADDVDTKDTRVTIHNNVLSADQRNPNVRHASVHMFNNLIFGYKYEGVVSSQNAKVIVENNVFIPFKYSIRKFNGIKADRHNQGDTESGYVWASGNLFKDGAGFNGYGLTQEHALPNSVLFRLKNSLFYPSAFDTLPSPFDVPYEYALDPADNELVTLLKTTVGTSP